MSRADGSRPAIDMNPLRPPHKPDRATSAPERPDAPSYPEGTARRLLATDLVTPQTREVLLARLNASGKSDPCFFDAAAFATLRAVCARLIPQTERPEPIDLAAAVDGRLARHEGKGWRYAALPPDAEAYRRGLQALDECARSRFGAAFAALGSVSQEELLHAVQRGDVAEEAWKEPDPQLFFEELLAELAESYYSHPLAQDEIGYAGYADAHGWQAVGLNRLAPHEPRALDAYASDGARASLPGAKAEPGTA